MPANQQITIVGGGLAGLVSAILLARIGWEVSLVERKTYPFHRVCGEYISNEVRAFLQKEKLIEGLSLAEITKFQLTSPLGRSLSLPLQMGGFGISRYQLDDHLYRLAEREGVNCLTSTQVKDIQYTENRFRVLLANQAKELSSDLVLGCFGKQSNLDNKLHRNLDQFDQGYIGVKYHIKTNFASDTIALHQFRNGYCGISKVGEETWNLCYLARKSEVKKAGSIEAMETETLSRNPYLKELFAHSDFLLPHRLVINQFGFYPKPLLSNHVIMLGDAAGSIPPLAGNGMAMAIHSAKIFVDTLSRSGFKDGKVSHTQLADTYRRDWNQYFATRLYVGRKLQAIFGRPILGELLVAFFANAPQKMSQAMIKMTHGQSI